MALATSLTERFCNSKAFTIIATHFQQLTSIGYFYRNVANYHFDVTHSERSVTDHQTNSTRHRAQTILERLNEDSTIGYPYTLRPGICKDVHYGENKNKHLDYLKR